MARTCMYPRTRTHNSNTKVSWDWSWHLVLLLTLIPHSVSGFGFLNHNLILSSVRMWWGSGWETISSVFINAGLVCFSLKYFRNRLPLLGVGQRLFFSLPTEIKLETQHFLCLANIFYFTILLGLWAFGPLGIPSRAPSGCCTALLQSSFVPGPKVLLKLNGLIYKTSANALRVPGLLGWASPAILTSTPIWLLRIKIT